MAVSVEGLASAVRGRVVEPGAPDYDESRALYNAMIDKRPAAIAYCVDEGDVAAALHYGVERGLRIAIRGGGHNGGGLGSVDDGLVIDLSQMNAIEVDEGAKVVRVQGGAPLKDMLEATHQHGLTVPVGIIGTTGAGGRTPAGAPGPPVPGGAPPAKGVRRRGDTGGRGGVRRAARGGCVGEATPRGGRGDAHARLEPRLRRAVPAGRSVVLARRVHPGDPGRGGRRTRRIRRGAADMEVDDAPLSDRRRGV